MTIHKEMKSFTEAVKDVFDGATIMVGGFGGVGGYPCYLVKALAKQGAKDLTLVANGTGSSKEGREKAKVLNGAIYPEWFEDVGLLFEGRQIKKMIASFPVSASTAIIAPFEKQFRAGEVECEVTPQGTLAERIRASKAGIGAFFTPTGPGTILGQGKEVRIIDGRPHVLEYPIKADFAFVRAYRADRLGNLVYRGTARNFNATMAGAATITIAEVDEVVPAGDLDPEGIGTPALYVNRIVVRPPEAKTRIVHKIRKDDRMEERHD